MVGSPYQVARKLLSTLRNITVMMQSNMIVVNITIAVDQYRQFVTDNQFQPFLIESVGY